MKLLKNTYNVTIGQRKLLTVLMLAFALTNSQVPAVHAAESVTQMNLTTLSQTFLEDSLQSEVITPPAAQLTVQEVLLDVCKMKGYGEDCAKTLLGMLWNESSNRFDVIGDGGRARGYFQIHYKLHNISIACAEDLACSANWTLTYMEAHSYPKYVAYAVQCHNSCNVNNGYAAKALRNGKFFWEKPLEINQAAPIELAMK